MRRCDMYTIDVDVSGALLDGRGPEVLRDFTEQVQQDVGQQAHSEVAQIMDMSFRHPTPYYETQVTVQQRGPDVIVHDRGVIYGPWLEGVSQRNAATRFKGYHMFRLATQRAAAQVEILAAHVFTRMWGRFE